MGSITFAQDEQSAKLGYAAGRGRVRLRRLRAAPGEIARQLETLSKLARTQDVILTPGEHQHCTNRSSTS